MFRSLPIVVALAVGGALLVSGCQSNTYKCTNGECHVTVTGSGQDIEINNKKISIVEISGSGLTVALDGGQPTTIETGQTAQVGGAEITVTSVDGDKVKFDLR